MTCIFTRAKFYRSEGKTGFDLVYHVFIGKAESSIRVCCDIVPYVADLKVLSHEQVEGGAGMAAYGVHAAAAVAQ